MKVSMLHPDPEDPEDLGLTQTERSNFFSRPLVKQEESVYSRESDSSSKIIRPTIRVIRKA